MKDALLSLWRILVNLAFSLFSCSSFTTLDWTPPILQHPYFELFITSCTLTHTSIWPLHSLNILTTHSHYLFNRQIACLCLVPFFVHISSFFWLLESHLDEGIQRSVFWKPRLFHYNFFRASASCWIWRDLASWVLWGRYLLSWQGILVLFCRVDPSGLQGWLC